MNETKNFAFTLSVGIVLALVISVAAFALMSVSDRHLIFKRAVEVEQAYYHPQTGERVWRGDLHFIINGKEDK